MEFSKSFGAEELGVWLAEHGIATDDIQLFKDEKVDGKSFCLLNESDLKEMGLKIGTRKVVNDLINTTNAGITEKHVWTLMDVFESAGSSVIYYAESRDSPSTSSAAVRNDNICVPTRKTAPSTLPQASSANAPHSTLLGFSITEALLESKSGRMLLNTLSLNLGFDPEERKLFVRLVVEKMVGTTGDVYPTPAMKELLAKTIVKEFPVLRATPRPGTEGHEHYYCAKRYSGFLESRFKTLHRVLTPSKRKYKARKTRGGVAAGTSVRLEEDLDLDDPPVSSAVLEEIEEKVIWMRHASPNTVNKSKIVECLFDTFKSRRAVIKDSKLTITAILDQYPRLLDFDGDMIEQDFQMMFPDSSKLAGRFVNHTRPRVLQRFEQKKLAMPETFNGLADDDLRALVQLAVMLPSTNVRRKNIMVDKHVNCLVTFVQVVTMPRLCSDWLDSDRLGSLQFGSPRLCSAGERYGSTPSLVQPSNKLAVFVSNSAPRGRPGNFNSLDRKLVSRPPPPPPRHLSSPCSPTLSSSSHSSSNSDRSNTWGGVEGAVCDHELAAAAQRSEQAMLRAHRDKERAWERELRRLQAAHDSRMRGGAQRAQLDQTAQALQAAEALRAQVSELRAQLRESERSVSEKTADCAQLTAQLTELQVSATRVREEFAREQQVWATEKEQVLRYQRQLQRNYVAMFRRARALGEHAAAATRPDDKPADQTPAQ